MSEERPDLLIGYLEDELDEDERREVEDLLARDPDAQASLDAYRAAAAALAQLDLPAPSEEARDRAFSAVLSLMDAEPAAQATPPESAAPPRGQLIQLTRWIAAAACLLLAGLLTLNTTKPATDAKVAAGEAAAEKTASAPTRKVPLETPQANPPGQGAAANADADPAAGAGPSLNEDRLNGEALDAAQVVKAPGEPASEAELERLRQLRRARPAKPQAARAQRPDERAGLREDDQHSELEEQAPQAGAKPPSAPSPDPAPESAPSPRQPSARGRVAKKARPDVADPEDETTGREAVEGKEPPSAGFKSKHGAFGAEDDGAPRDGAARREQAPPKSKGGRPAPKNPAPKNPAPERPAPEFAWLVDRGAGARVYVLRGEQVLFTDVSPEVARSLRGSKVRRTRGGAPSGKRGVSAGEGAADDADGATSKQARPLKPTLELKTLTHPSVKAAASAAKPDADLRTAEDLLEIVGGELGPALALQRFERLRARSRGLRRGATSPPTPAEARAQRVLRTLGREASVDRLDTELRAARRSLERRAAAARKR